MKPAMGGISSIHMVVWQGVNDLYTDPQIHSTRVRGGPTEGNQQAFGAGTGNRVRIMKQHSRKMRDVLKMFSLSII